MLNLEKAFRSTHAMRALIGLDHSKFLKLLPRFEQFLNELPYQKARIRQPEANPGRQYNPKMLMVTLSILFTSVPSKKTKLRSVDQHQK